MARGRRNRIDSGTVASIIASSESKPSVSSISRCSTSDGPIWRGMKLPASMCRSAVFVDCLVLMRNPHETPRRLRSALIVLGAEQVPKAASAYTMYRSVVVRRLESTESVKEIRLFSAYHDVASSPFAGVRRRRQHGDG